MVREDDGVFTEHWREGGRVPDLDALETTVRDGMLGFGARGYSVLIEALDAELPAPPCPDCGRRMERHCRIGKTFPARLGRLRSSGYNSAAAGAAVPAFRP